VDGGAKLLVRLCQIAVLPVRVRVRARVRVGLRLEP
jgi:hypothetical protein